MKLLIKTTIYLLCLCGFALASLTGQSQTTVKMMSKRDGQTVKLRWAPVNANIWLNQRTQGYRISRLVWDQENTIRPENYKVIAELKPLSLEAFETAFNQDQTNASLGIMAEAIYGEWETLKQGDVATENWVNKVEELNTKYTMAMVSADMDFEAAKAGALAFEDQDLDPSKKYVYKLETLGDSVAIAAVHVVQKSNALVNTVILKESIEGEGKVTLKWQRQAHERMFTAYHIERSKDGSNYQRLTDLPFLNPVTASVPESKHTIKFAYKVDNYDPYFYRVIGIDPFGDLSNPSKAVRLEGKDLTPPEFPRIDSIISDTEVKYMNIAWTYINSSDDWDKTVVQKSIDAEGPFKDIVSLPKMSKYYKDEDIANNSRYYYRICAVDTSGNYGCTGTMGGVINDKTPPIKPNGLTGVIDTNGVVTIKWTANTELDLKGYYVHFSNGGNRVFGNLSKTALMENVFTDTLDLNTLTETIEYKINAVDYRQNYSDFSDVLVLKKPDLIPPSPAIFKSYQIENDGVAITIVNSSSKDFMHSELLRTSEQEADVLIKRFDDKLLNFKDTTVAFGQKYIYNLVSYDDDGNSSQTPKSLVVKTKDKKQLHEIELSMKAVEGGVELEWSKPVSPEGKAVIYKSNGKRQVTLKTLPADTMKFMHKTSQSYQYQMRIEYSDGSYSAFSNLISL